MMSLAKRGPMQNISRQVRAFFAPVNRVTNAPAYFDPAQYSAFDVDAPPAPWIVAGTVEDFQRTSLTGQAAIACGAKGAVVNQYRTELAAEVAFNFREWGKLQLALSCGSQVMNVLVELGTPFPAPSGGVANNPVGLLAGSSATELVVGIGAVAGFAVGDLVAVDVDYSGATGFVGTGIAAAYVKDPALVNNNPDYVRRVTFNVGRVRGTSANSLLLAQPLPGGAPLGNAQVQKIRAFVEREGGSFFQEWSALFVVESETGAKIFYHYPRVQNAKNGTEAHSRLANAFDAWSLPARLTALPTVDANDQEQVLCYRSLVPAAGAAVL